MLVLRFDSESFALDLCKSLTNAADEIMQHFLQDAKSRMKSNDYELDEATFDEVSKKINATCTFYAKAIIESYGTGSEMDMSNEALSDYIGNVEQGWNPLRTGTTIVGRKEGFYINFLGERAYSKGTMAGKSVEAIIPARKPSYAIQHAEKKLDAGLKQGGYAHNILNRYISEFLTNTSQYFRNEEISV